MKDQGSMTDCNPVDLACITSSVSTQKKMKKEIIKKTIGTQTTFDDEKCLSDIPTFSPAPNLSYSPLQIYSEPDFKSEIEDVKIRWMFSNPKSCARSRALRPQVRLLRVLKKNMIRKGIWKPGISHVLKEEIIPDKVIWDALGFQLQKVFVRLALLCQLLEGLPLDYCLKVKSDSLAKMLKHLTSHLPLPINLRRNSMMGKSSVPSMSLYLKELTQLLRFLHSNKYAVVFPYYFRAETAVLERVAHKTLEYVLQDMRHKCNGASSLNSDDEFSSNCSNKDHNFNNDDSLTISGTDVSVDILPMQAPKKPITEKCGAQTLDVCIKKRLFGKKVFKSRIRHNHLYGSSHSDLSSSKSPSHQAQRLKGNFTSQCSGVIPLGTSKVALSTGVDRLRACPASFMKNISKDIATESRQESVQDKVLVHSDVPQSSSLTVRTAPFTQSLEKLSCSLRPLPVHSIPLVSLNVISISESVTDSDCPNKSMLLTPQSVKLPLVLLASNKDDSIVSSSVAIPLSTGSVPNANLKSATSVPSGNCMYTELVNSLANSTPSLSLSKMSVQNISRLHPSQISARCSILSEHSYSKVVADSTPGLNTGFTGCFVKNPPVALPSVATTSCASNSIVSGLFAGNETPVSSNWGKTLTQDVLASHRSTSSRLVTEVRNSNTSLPRSLFAGNEISFSSNWTKKLAQDVPVPHCSSSSRLLTEVNNSNTSLPHGLFDQTPVSSNRGKKLTKDVPAPHRSSFSLLTEVNNSNTSLPHGLIAGNQTPVSSNWGKKLTQDVLEPHCSSSSSLLTEVNNSNTSLPHSLIAGNQTPVSSNWGKKLAQDVLEPHCSSSSSLLIEVNNSNTSLPHSLFAGNQTPVSSNRDKKLTQVVPAPHRSSSSSLLTEVNTSLPHGLFAGNQTPVSSNQGKKLTQVVPAPHCSTSSSLLTEVNNFNTSVPPLQPKQASRPITQLSHKAGIDSKLTLSASAISELNAPSKNSRTTYSFTSPSTTLCYSSSSTTQTIGSIVNCTHSDGIKLPTTQVLAQSGNSGSTKNQKLKNGKPTILNAVKLKNKIVLKWSFPNDLHPHVKKYMVYFGGMESTAGVHKNWCKFGRVEPSPLPITLTLTFTESILNCIISVKAIYLNGQCSDLSDVVIV